MLFVPPVGGFDCRIVLSCPAVTRRGTRGGHSTIREHMPRAHQRHGGMTPEYLITRAGRVGWLSIANRQLELKAKYMTELGLTPASRSRLLVPMEEPWEFDDRVTNIVISWEHSGL